MAKRIKQYEGLYGDRTMRPDDNYLFSELLETRSRDFDWDIKPHLHPRIYQIFFIERGSFQLYEASQQRLVNGPCLILIPPMALHGFAYDEGVNGRIITLADTLVDMLFSGSEFLVPMLHQMQCLASFNDQYTADDLKRELVAIDKELSGQQAEKNLMLHACLQMLFLNIYRLWRQHLVTPAEPDHIALGYFRRFQQRMRQTGNKYNIAQLAGELGITPVHLNRVCHAIAGKSAGQLVQEYQLEEARKYLTYTSYSVAEIAYLLHFEYPNYFARFFRKHTGLSPKQFRDGQAGQRS